MEPKEKIVILYVEDEDEPRELIGDSIVSEFPELTLYLARDGREGLELYRERRPDLVVTDILMPVQDGLQMAETIKAIDPQTELIALTAYSDTSFLLRAIEIGFSHYVLKPIDYDRLFAAIRKSLDVIELRLLVKEQNERIRSFASELEGKVEERTRELQESRNELAQRNAKLRELTTKLKAARDRYWSLYNWSPLGYLSLDDDFVIREINITGAHMLGAKRADLKGTSIKKHLSPENVTLLAEAFQECIMEDRAQVELEILLPESMFLYVKLHCVPYREENETRNLYRTALVDISRVKEAEEKLRESERLLIQQSRLAAMGEMIVNISHQWRQPLNALGAMVQELGLSHKYGGFSEELLNDNINKVMEIIQNMSQTINDFQNYLSPSKGKMHFRVDQVIAKTVSLIEEHFKYQGISIDISSTGEPQINGYPNEYGQALLNLLTNAKDALLERGVADARIKVRSWAENGRAVVTVTDNAGGIKEEILNKIFDAYFTTKELGKGTGVGLFMSKNIIETNIGGRLSVRNVEGGAEFKIEV